MIAAKNDKLQLKCTAKIGNAYWESVVVETTLRRDGYMLESRSSGASGKYRTAMIFWYMVMFHNSPKLSNILSDGFEKMNKIFFV